MDAVVVGGGYTGLSTALALRAEGLSVAVVEARTCGFGASGRNAGHLTPTIGKDLPTLMRLFGHDRVASLVGLVELAIDEVERLIRVHAIECEYEAVGNVIAAVHPRQFANIDRAAAAARAFGLPGELLEPDAMRARGLPGSFLRGYHEPHGGILHPGLYVAGLRRAALACGATIFEESPVLRVEDGQRPCAHTQEGSVRGRVLVIATNAYARGLPLPAPLPAYMMPAYVQLLQTAPLNPAQLAAVGWQGHEGLYTAHEALESWRLTRDNRIVGGAKHVRYGYAGRVLPDADADVALRLDAVYRRRFPELADVEITQTWGGRIGFALDFLPVVGRTGKANNIYYSMSYAGHGIAMATYSGRMVADLVAGRSGPGAALWARRSLRLPPEPFRWLVFHALNGFFEGVDRRVDRLVG